MSTELTIAKARVEKAAAVGAITMAEQIDLFDGIDKLLKDHAKKKHPQLSSEGAFVKELEHDEQFRSIVKKSQSLQEEMNNSG